MVTDSYSYRVDQYFVVDPTFYDTNGTNRFPFLVKPLSSIKHCSTFDGVRTNDFALAWRHRDTIRREYKNESNSRTLYTEILYKLKCGEIGLKIMSRKNAR